MSDYRLDITGTIGLSDFTNINDYIDLVGLGDKFTITIDESNIKETELICGMLRSHNFYIVKKGYNEKGKAYISAQKGKNT